MRQGGRGGFYHVSGVKSRFCHAHGPTLVEKVKGCKVLSTTLTGRHKISFGGVQVVTDMTKSIMSFACHKRSFAKVPLA